MVKKNTKTSRDSEVTTKTKKIIASTSAQKTLTRPKTTVKASGTIKSRAAPKVLTPSQQKSAVKPTMSSKLKKAVREASLEREQVAAESVIEKSISSKSLRKRPMLKPLVPGRILTAEGWKRRHTQTT